MSHQDGIPTAFYTNPERQPARNTYFNIGFHVIKLSNKGAYLKKNQFILVWLWNAVWIRFPKTTSTKPLGFSFLLK